MMTLTVTIDVTVPDEDAAYLAGVISGEHGQVVTGGRTFEGRVR